MEVKQQPVVIKGVAIERVRPSSMIVQPRSPHSKPFVQSRPDIELRQEPRRRMSVLRSGRPRASMGFRTPRAFMPSRAPRATTQTGARTRSRQQASDDSIGTVKLIRNTAIAISIVLLVFLLKSINLPFTQKLVDYVRTAVTEDLDWDETLGHLKFVGDYIPDIQAVFNPDTNENNPVTAVGLSAPVEGQVIRLFSVDTAENRERNLGIDVSVDADAPIRAAAEGQIAEILEEPVYGTSVWISHGDGIFTFYGGCSGLLVEKGQKVTKGQQIGTVKEQASGLSVLHFEVWIDNTPVDPLSCISVESTITV
jgi:murein DD-endopeptidase MepM/ murein hydrolase activator NlpD